MTTTKRMRLLLLSVVIMLVTVLSTGMIPKIAFAETDTATGLNYTMADGEATITGFSMPDGFDGNLVIPPTLGGATVTSIGEKAFQSCGAFEGTINSITIPGGVTSIGEAAFKDCRAKSINIPDSVTSIGDSAFNHCHAESIIIPVGVTSIGDYTFQGCHAESIIIPGSVTSIGSCAFNACTFTSITIPEGVTNLGEKAFYGCSITSITIPSSMKSIGINAFQDCQRLESVTILPGITELGGFVFNECNSLTRVDIPVSVTKIDSNTFYNCPNVTIYGSVGSYAEQYAENNKINFASNDTYQIVLNKNGGDTEAIPNVVAAAGRFDSLSITPPTRQDWKFAGWNTEPGGTGTTITDDTVINEPLTIYAQWTIDTPAGFNDNDFQKLLAFAQQGENATKLGWVLTEPGTWAGVTWNDAAEKRVTAIDCYSHSIYENHLIGSLDLSNFTVLAKLDCSLNDLEFLDISGCTALKELDCSDNALTSLDISSCTLLTELDCSYDDLEFLDLSGCTALVKLDCSYNTLESLDISGFSLLEELDCSYDDLEFLDLSGCTALKVLDCPYNYLTSLDVSGCTALEELSCYGNALTSLNISGCSALTYLDCEDNADLELIWGLNQLEDDINTDNTEFYSDQSLADLLAKEQAVLTVDSQIAALLDASELTLADEESVSAAEAAYNSLSAVQKTFVSNYDKLVAAKNKIIKLKGGSSRGGSGSTPSGTQVTSSGRNFSQNGVTLSFPAGAVESDVRVQVKETGLSAGMDLPDNSQLLSRIMDIVKDKSGNFSQPVTITLSFNKSEFDPDEYDIAIYYYDEDTGKWIALDNIRLNFKSGTISGDTAHFTKFAVIATPKAIKEEKPAKPVTPQPTVNIPTDISGHWAKDSIMKMIDARVVSGYPDQTFKPDKTITRAEFTVMLVKALNLETRVGKTFSDTASHWAKDSISTAAAQGLISGYDENTFGPDDLITREQAAVIIVRATQLEAVTGELNFTDSQAISPWAKSDVAVAVKTGFITGYPDNSFRPQDNSTRAEAAVIIGKLL